MSLYTQGMEHKSTKSKQGISESNFEGFIRNFQYSRTNEIKEKLFVDPGGAVWLN